MTRLTFRRDGIVYLDRSVRDRKVVEYIRQLARRGGGAVAVVADDVEQQMTENVVTEQRALRGAVRLPPARIVFVPFSLVEVELLMDDE